jgi:hypothetical protein
VKHFRNVFEVTLDNLHTLFNQLLSRGDEAFLVEARSSKELASGQSSSVETRALPCLPVAPTMRIAFDMAYNRAEAEEKLIIFRYSLEL